MEAYCGCMAGRELNPYFAGGGSGMPTPAAEKTAAGGTVGKGDGGVAWLTKVKFHLVFSHFFFVRRLCMHNYQFTQQTFEVLLVRF